MRGIQAQLGIEKGLVKPWEEHGTIIEHSSIFLIEHGFGFGSPVAMGPRCREAMAAEVPEAGPLASEGSSEAGSAPSGGILRGSRGRELAGSL